MFTLQIFSLIPFSFSDRHKIRKAARAAGQRRWLFMLRLQSTFLCRVSYCRSFRSSQLHSQHLSGYSAEAPPTRKESNTTCPSPSLPLTHSNDFKIRKHNVDVYDVAFLLIVSVNRTPFVVFLFFTLKTLYKVLFLSMFRFM